MRGEGPSFVLVEAFALVFLAAEQSWIASMQ
jgi:hypothetical protein